MWEKERELEVIEGVVKELGDTHFLIARVGGSSFPWAEAIP
jgi:hypothetical protein